MIGDRDVLETAGLGPLRHLADRRGPVCGGRVHVQIAPDVVQFNQPGKPVLLGQFEFAPVFAQFTFGFPGHGETIGYPIPGLDDSVAPGERRYNFLWYYPVDAGAALADLLTDAAGRLHAWSIPPALIRPEHIAALQRDAAARLPAPYEEAPRRARQFLVQPIYDLESPAMNSGRVALLGDAAFVARPHIGIGVLKAAEDALALAEALDGGAEVPEALAQYSAARIPPSRAAVAMSRHLGAFIERRLPRPEADPSLGLTLPRLLALSGRPLEQTAEARQGPAA